MHRKDACITLGLIGGLVVLVAALLLSTPVTTLAAPSATLTAANWSLTTPFTGRNQGARSKPPVLEPSGSPTYVSITTGSDVTGTGSTEAPFRTIAFALSQTSDDGVVHAAQGTYAGGLVLSRGISLMGGYPVVDGGVDWFSQTLEAYVTTVDAGGLGAALTIAGDSSCLVEGLTLVHGQNTFAGGGVYIASGAVPTLRHNWILNNVSDQSGGGIAIEASGPLTPTIISNTVSGNVAYGLLGGGGIYVNNNGPVIIRGNLVTGNEAGNGNGGGITVSGNSAARISGNEIVGNISAISGGGIASVDAWPTIHDNRILSNTCALSGGGISVGGPGTPGPTITANTIAGNTANSPGAAGGGIFVVDRPSLIQGNLIAANTASYGAGGGVQLVGESDAQIVANDVLSNQSLGAGAGIAAIFGAQPLIQFNQISENVAGHAGGGLFVNEAWPSILSNQFLSNTTEVSGGGIYLRATSIHTPTIISNTFTGNVSYQFDGGGGGIYLEGETNTVVLDNDFAYNYAEGAGGAICTFEDAWPTIRNNRIWQNSTGHAGAGINIDAASWPVVESNLIVDNTSGGVGGGGICISGDGTQPVTVITNTISGNLSSGDDGGGGGLMINDRPAIVHGNLISNNQVHPSVGGGLYLTGQTSAQVLSNEISGNTSSGTGGGVYICEEAWPTLHDNLIRDNTTGESGGGVAIGGTGVLTPTLISNTISHNTALSPLGGGGLWIHDRHALLQDNLIAANQAANGSGGGLYISGATDVHLFDNTISGNAAALVGAGVAILADAPAILSGNFILDNTAQQSGGGIGIYALAWPTVIENHVEGNTAGKSGGGIYIAGFGTAAPQIISNTIAGNVSLSGGGIHGHGRPILLQGNTLTTNQASNGLGGGLYLTGATNAAVVANQIVANTAATGGGGVAAYGDAWPTLSHNQIQGNTSTGAGGGILLGGSGPQSTSILENTVVDNVSSSGDGGGIYVSNRPALIQGNTVTANQAVAKAGGGLSLAGNSSAQVLGNRILGNQSTGVGGGAMVRSTGSPILANNLIRDNSSSTAVTDLGVIQSSPALHHNTLVGTNLPGKIGLYVSVGSQPSIVNNIVANYDVGAYCTSPVVVSYSLFYNTRDILGCSPENVVFADPLLADEVHLLSGSPAIDAGSSNPGLATDLDGDPRPLGSGYDIGADEFVP